MISCLIIIMSKRQLTLFESFHKRNRGTSDETSDDSENEKGSDHDMELLEVQ